MMLSAALLYAEIGWKILPLYTVAENRCDCARGDSCSSPGKHPRTQRGVHDASSEEGQIRAWWAQWPESNVGIQTGEESGVCVIDVDCAGSQSLERFGPPVIDDCPIVDTPSGGYHIYVAHPGYHVINDVGRHIGPGVDIRGDHGYVVAPPSNHIQGMYAWRINHHIKDRAVQAVSDRFLPAKPAPVRPTVVRVTVDGDEQSPYIRSAIRNECHRVIDAPLGQRNITLNTAAFALAQFVSGTHLRESTVMAALTDAAKVTGLDDTEIRKTLLSGMTAGKKEPRSIPPDKREYEKNPDNLTTATSEDAGNYETEYLCVPGRHYIADGYRDVLISDFCEGVTAKLPTGDSARLFNRSGVAVNLEGRVKGRKKLHLTNSTRCRTLLDGFGIKPGRFTKGKGGQIQHEYCPWTDDIAKLFLSSVCDHDIPELEALVSYPVYQNDWQRVAPGYNPDSHIFYDRPDRLDGLRDDISVDDIHKIIDDALYDWPFAHETAQHNAVGLLVTIICRFAISGNVPLHMCSATKEGTGKTKLVSEFYGYTLMDKTLPALHYSSNDEEQDKRILSMLLSGSNVYHLDNIDKFMSSAALASLLTCQEYAGRVLGQNSMVEVQNNLVLIGSGNAIEGSPEIVRRTVPIELEPIDESPHYRSGFRHEPLIPWLQQNSGNLISAVISMVERWKAAGQPKTSKRMGSFEDWNDVVSGIMHANQFTAWRSNEREWRQLASPWENDLRILVRQWRENHVAPVTVAELMPLVEANQLFADMLARCHGERASLAALSRLLTQRHGVCVGDLRINRLDLDGKKCFQLSPL